MKIGFTEQGDGGINTTWFDKLESVDGAIIITKKLTDDCIEKLITASKPVILHCGCTGNGGTALEPNVPDYTWQMSQLQKLIDRGFPTNRIVLRIDPIIPTIPCLNNVAHVLDYVIARQMPITRFRISVYDEYKHVKERLRAIGQKPFYGDAFYASPEMMNMVVTTLERYPFTFETCAEDLCQLNPNKFQAIGCVSPNDIRIMGLTLPEGLGENGQNRHGCHCLTCKTELLNCRAQCGNGCIYCYWRTTTYPAHKTTAQ